MRALSRPWFPLRARPALHRPTPPAAVDRAPGQARLGVGGRGFRRHQHVEQCRPATGHHVERPVDGRAQVIGALDTFSLQAEGARQGRVVGKLQPRPAGNALLALATALEFGFSREDTGLLVMPLCYANSLYFGLTFIYLNATVVVDDRKSFDPEGLLATLARDKVTFTPLVPTHFIITLALPAGTKARHDVSAVGKLLISAAPGAQGNQTRSWRTSGTCACSSCMAPPRPAG